MAPHIERGDEIPAQGAPDKSRGARHGTHRRGSLAAGPSQSLWPHAVTRAENLKVGQDTVSRVEKRTDICSYLPFPVMWKPWAAN